MNHKEFWSLIDEVNREAESWNRDSILLTTQEKLLQFSQQEIIGFHNYLKWYMDLADTPNLVAAAVAINDGTSDDGFTDFRAWLVSQGQEVYRKALKRADSLAELDIPQEGYYTQFEFYGYIGSYAYEVKSLLEQKSIQEIGTNEYFELKPKGRELVEHKPAADHGGAPVRRSGAAGGDRRNLREYLYRIYGTWADRSGCQ